MDDVLGEIEVTVPESGEGKQAGEMPFREGDQILHQHSLRGGEQSALQ